MSADRETLLASARDLAAAVMDFARGRNLTADLFARASTLRDRCNAALERPKTDDVHDWFGG